MPSGFSKGPTGPAAGPLFIGNTTSRVDNSAQPAVVLLRVEASSTTTPTFVKQVGKQVTVTSTTTSTFTKQVGKVWTVTSTTTPSVLIQKVLLFVFSVTCTTTPTFVKQVGKLVTRTVTTTPTFVKQVAKVWSVTATTTSSFVKRIAQTFLANATASPVYQSGASHGLTFSVTVICTPTYAFVFIPGGGGAVQPHQFVRTNLFDMRPQYQTPPPRDV